MLAHPFNPTDSHLTLFIWVVWRRTQQYYTATASVFVGQNREEPTLTTIRRLLRDLPAYTDRYCMISIENPWTGVQKQLSNQWISQSSLFWSRSPDRYINSCKWSAPEIHYSDNREPTLLYGTRYEHWLVALNIPLCRFHWKLSSAFLFTTSVFIHSLPCIHFHCSLEGCVKRRCGSPWTFPCVVLTENFRALIFILFRPLFIVYPVYTFSVPRKVC